MSKVIKALIVLLVILVLSYGAYLLFIKKETPKSSSNSNPGSAHTITESSAQPGFNKALYPIDKPGSPWWVVNKRRPLPDTYVPGDLEVPNVKLRLARTAPQMQFSKSAIPALAEMFSAASKDGITLVFGSGYRSYELQKQFYEQYVAQDGQADADRYSARPGTSEHQTGITFDATSVNENCHLEICFEDTNEGKWLYANAFKFGFIVRYPAGKESVTGYQYEPWHMRYVGKELSAEMKRTGVLTLEEFFGLPAAPTYN